MSECTQHGRWRVERRLNLGTLLSVATSMVVVVSLVAGMAARLEATEQKLCGVERRLEGFGRTVLKVERIDERVLGIRSILLEIKEELRTGRKD